MLCATTVASLSTFGALSQAVFADIPKAEIRSLLMREFLNRQSELSVPASVKFDTEVGGYKIHNDKIEIVKSRW